MIGALMEKSSVALRVASFAGAALRRAGRALLHRHADPRKRGGDQEVTDGNQNRQHRLLPQCSTRHVRRSQRRYKLATPIVAQNCEACATTHTVLDAPTPRAMFRAMLQHNTRRRGQKAHVAHVAVVALHAICCGLPALAMLAAAVSGATSGVALLAESFEPFHDFLHQHEIWILGVSALLVVTGGVLEVVARRAPHNHGFPWLFAFSVLCFLANVAIIVAHRA